MLFYLFVDALFRFVRVVVLGLPPSPWDPGAVLPHLVSFLGVMMELNRAFPIAETWSLFGVLGAMLSTFGVFKVYKHVVSYFAGAGTG